MVLTPGGPAIDVPVGRLDAHGAVSTHRRHMASWRMGNPAR